MDMFLYRGYIGIIGYILGLFGDTKENGNYYMFTC